MNVLKECKYFLSLATWQHAIYGLKHAFKSFGYSCAGLWTAIHREESFRQEIIWGCIHLGATWLLPLGLSIQLFMTMLWVIMMSMELMNSAIEAVVDKASPEWSELAKRAKDMASAAVFINIFGIVVTWAILLVMLFF